MKAAGFPGALVVEVRTLSPRDRVMAGLALLLVLAAFVVATGSGAAMTIGLIQTVPAQGATVAPGLQHLMLEFNEEVDANASSVTLTTDNGLYFGPARLGTLPGAPNTLIASLPAMLGTGAYQVHWHAALDNARTADGSYGFAVTPWPIAPRDR